MHIVTASSEAAAAAGGPGTAGPVDAQKVAKTKKVGAKASCCSSRTVCWRRGFAASCARRSCSGL